MSFLPLLQTFGPHPRASTESLCLFVFRVGLDSVVMEKALFVLEPVQTVLNLTPPELKCAHDVYLCFVAPGAVGAFHENEHGAAPQAGRRAGPAEDLRGEEGRHGGRPEGENQDHPTPDRAAARHRQQRPRRLQPPALRK